MEFNFFQKLILKHLLNQKMKEDPKFKKYIVKQRLNKINNQTIK